MTAPLGKRIVDISSILEDYEAQEGEVQHITGKTGMGKTYEATRRAIGYLKSGYTVYTTWRLNLEEYYDEREHFWPTLRNFIFARSSYVRIPLKENWHFLDLRTFEDKETHVIDTARLSRYVASLTDCILMMDEGQDTFDSHKKGTAEARQSITRTRHMHKTLIIISQRAAAVDVTARANVTYFYKCVKIQYLFWTRFIVYRTEEIDENNNHPIWERHDSTGRVVWKAQNWHSGWAKKWIYDSYDSWYMRQEMIRSQDLKLEAYKLNFSERYRALFKAAFGRKKKVEVINKLSPVQDVKPVNEAILNAWDRQKPTGDFLQRWQPKNDRFVTEAKVIHESVRAVSRSLPARVGSEIRI